MKTVEAARGKWYGILRHFGLDDRYLRNKHSECPMCGGSDRYRFDDKDGSGSYYCNGCGSGSGMDLLIGITGMDFKRAAAAVDEIIGNVEFEQPKPKRDPRPRLEAIRKALQSADGINPVRKYLHGRGLSPVYLTKYHPAMEYFEDGKATGKHPAMVHVFQAANGRPLTYHITYLTTDGKKAQLPVARKVMPPMDALAGGAIRLCLPAEVMGIAEGIETALAASKRYKLPVWAAYSATLLKQWEPPPECKRVVIFGDNDASFTGQEAAYALAKKLANMGITTSVLIPETIGADFADEVAR